MPEASTVTEFAVLWRKLEQLHRRTALRRLERSTDNEGKLYQASLRRFEALGFKQLQRDDLERKLPSTSSPTANFIRDRVSLCLKPTEKGNLMIPVVCLVCDFDRDPAKVAIKAGLCTFNSNGELRVLGCRFESPEGDGMGRHDFYHMQLVNALEKGVPALNKNDAQLGWLPDSQPSFPVDADCPISLTLAFLVSVYGLWYLDEVVREEMVPPPQLDRLSCWRHRPRFWRARGGVSGWQYFCDGLRREEPVLKGIIATHLGSTVPDTRMTKITAKEYRDAPEDHKMRV